LKTRTPQSKKNGCRQATLGGCSCSVLGLGTLILLPGLIYLSLVAIGAGLIVSDPVERVDAVVVLSGGEGDRMGLAIEMHADGFAPNLVITDTASGVNNRMVGEAMEGGFDRENIFVTELQVDSTYDEALAVRDLALDRNWDQLMVVTDPYHTFRTRLIFRRELWGSGIEILVRPVNGHWFRSQTWFTQAEGWQFVLLEFGKLINYLFFTG
jgi:uncharacterized SAM-binding protein YcdF (DUF218 family)